jgi:transposase
MSGNVTCGYEAGPTGFGLKRALEAKGIGCRIMAPATILTCRGGSRVKTDRLDARRLAKALHWHAFREVVPLGPKDEACRDYIRMRDDRKQALKRAKQDLLSFLLRRDAGSCPTKHPWTEQHLAWLQKQRFAEPVDQLAFDAYLRKVFRLTEAVELCDAQIALVRTG